MRSIFGAVAVILVHGCARTLDLGDDRDASPSWQETPCGEGAGICQPGRLCDRPCERCHCTTKQEWFCAKTCDDLEPNCPREPPPPRSSCASVGTRCSYPSACPGATDAVVCLGERWEYYYGECPRQDCPPEVEPPPEGSPCQTDGLSCVVLASCGVRFRVRCLNASWTSDGAVPCTGTDCPETAPANGEPCIADTCEWKNECGTTDYGACIERRWQLKRTCRPVGCPSSPPVAGASCRPEGLKCSWPDGCARGERYAWCEQAGWRTEGCLP